MSLQIVFSNRMEVLAGRLMEELARVPADPFEAQHVVVPTAAVSRYLQLALAEKSGICANVRFSYPARWLWQMAGVIDPDVPGRSPVDPAVMTWLILHFLENEKFASYSRIGRFLKDADDMMRFELARSAAQIFDQYATYRPDWLKLWSEKKKIPDFSGKDEDEDWQSELWRMIARELGLKSRHPLETALNSLLQKDFPAESVGLPKSAAIFAVPVIAPLYLQTMGKLSHIMDVTLYLMNPCREYWFDIVPPVKLAYLQNVRRDGYREIGNSLLAEWGQATQSAIDLVYEELPAGQTSDEAGFIEPAGHTLLENLQKSIMVMEDLAPGSLRMSGTDRSIEIHCCYAAVRELEVLHSRLLELFAADATLRTDDVVVLTPDIDTLAPAVDAVFGAAPPNRKIPYTIAGRAMESTNAYLTVLIDLLDLLSSRMPAGRVFDFLRQPPVARRFDLDEGGLTLVRDWMIKSGMRWGLDGRHRAELGVPAQDLHTLQRGLDVLMMGVSLPKIDEPLGGYMPACSLEGSRADMLGQFWLLIERLAFWKDEFRHPQPASRWQEMMGRMLADFTVGDSDVPGEYERMLGAIAELAENWRDAKLQEPLSPRVVRAALLDADKKRRGAVPSGMVTFASLAAMRGIPYRVVCLLGMNDGSFPAGEHPVEFDLIARGKPRRGDRQRRLEDRGLFLDAILATREILHISFTGRDQKSDAEIPPSVVVDRLLDYLAVAVHPDSFGPDNLQNARERLMVRHPLQPFSRRYFDGSDPRLTSYAGPYADALNQTAVFEKFTNFDNAEDNEEDDRRQPESLFFDGFPKSVKTNEPELSVVAMEDLSDFLQNPSRYFLKHQLKIFLPEKEDAIADEEPLLIDFSGKRNLAQRIIEACLSGRRVLSAHEALDIVTSLPDAPPGAACEAGLTIFWTELESLAQRLLEATAQCPVPPGQATISLNVNGHSRQLAVHFSDLRPCGLVRYRCDELRGYDHLRSWVDHLALCACAPEGVRLETKHLAFDGNLMFEPMTKDEATGHLARLVQLYDEGLLQPLPFFRKTAWEYVKEDMNKAKRKWAGGQNVKGEPEGADAWHALAWRGVENPLDDRFIEVAKMVYDPIVIHGKIDKMT